MATKKAPAAKTTEKKEKRPFTGNKKINAIKIDDIIKYCEEHNEMAWFEWATSQPSSRIKKNGEACEITFYELRALFVDKFMPDIKVPEKPKGKTWRDKANEALAAAAASGK